VGSIKLAFTVFDIQVLARRPAERGVSLVYPLRDSSPSSATSGSGSSRHGGAEGADVLAKWRGRHGKPALGGAGGREALIAGGDGDLPRSYGEAPGSWSAVSEDRMDQSLRPPRVGCKLRDYLRVTHAYGSHARNTERRIRRVRVR
jgi:hypothetical protein